MKKRISLSLFLTVLWKGICQVLESLARFLGYKGESRFMKVVWHLLMVSFIALVVFLTGCVLFVFCTEVVYEKWVRPHDQSEVYESTSLSRRLEFQKVYSSDQGQIYDKLERKVLLRDVDWVVTANREDSLAVYCQYGKRGYLNRFTGDIVIPLSYTKAWVFSEGLAAVERNGQLVFVDSAGRVKIDKGFEIDEEYSLDHVFKNGYCIARDSKGHKLGVIDHAGNWGLSPIYDKITNDHGFWNVTRDNKVGLFNSKLEMMFPIDNVYIYVGDSTIDVRMANHVAKRYDYAGNLLVDFIIDDVENLYYETDHLRQDTSRNEYGFDNLKIYDIATCMAYEVYNGLNGPFYGLLDRNGNVLTPPLYQSISAVGRDLYLCRQEGILLNSKGERISAN